jgi:GNAT superfamily N-acetyltransferase
MTKQVTFVSASSYSLDALGDIFTRSFENYFYPGTTTAAILSGRVRTEQIDLQRSLVMEVGGDQAGIALLGLRGDRAWCGGFGVMLPFRGRGLAHKLAAAMLDQARQAGVYGCGLEVLTRNQAAISTYLRAGFKLVRDLLILEWRRPQVAEQDANVREDGSHLPSITEAQPDALLGHFVKLHPVPAAWQRDLPTLLVRSGMQGLALMESERPRAYALLTPMPDGGARIADFGAEDTGQAALLLTALQARYAGLLSINEPVDSTLTPAFAAAGFLEADRQHELWIDL